MQLEQTSNRWRGFVVVVALFWMIVPLWIMRLLIGGAVPLVGVVVCWGVMWFLAPKINAWLVHNTPWAAVWHWAREHERDERLER